MFKYQHAYSLKSVVLALTRTCDHIVWNEFKVKQESLHLPAHKLIIDVSTHWNSAFDMLECYIEQQAAVMAVLMDKDIRKNLSDVPTLSEQDITVLEQAIQIPEPLYSFITLLCDAHMPTVSLILPLKERLLSHLE